MSFTKRIAIESSMIHFRRSLSVWCIALGAGWAGAAVTAPPEDLINAANSGDAAIVQALLAKGADVNAKANNGATALMLASQNGHNEVVQDLLAKGADVNAKMTDGATALFLASLYRHNEVVQALLA